MSRSRVRGAGSWSSATRARSSAAARGAGHRGSRRGSVRFGLGSISVGGYPTPMTLARGRVHASVLDQMKMLPGRLAGDRTVLRGILCLVALAHGPGDGSDRRHARAASCLTAQASCSCQVRHLSDPPHFITGPRSRGLRTGRGFRPLLCSLEWSWETKRFLIV